MIKLHASLLALTLATGSALASSSGFDSDTKHLYMRGDQELFKHHPVRRFVFGYAMGNHHWHHHFKPHYYIQAQELEDEQELFGRDLDAEELVEREYNLLDERDTFDDLEAREPLELPRMGGHHTFGLSRIRTGLRQMQGHHRFRFRKGMNQLNDQGQNQGQDNLQSREFEDDQELFGRDFEDQELLGREYDTLDERDLSDDLEVREPTVSGAVGEAFRLAEKHRHHIETAASLVNAFQSRELEDEELFERDLDAEELFGREYDLLDDLD